MIEVRNLTKTYGRTTAVRELTFTVRSGVVTGFLGPNGAGKSTTMRVAIGLDHPTSGQVLVNGRGYAEHSAPLHEVGALLDPKAAHPGRTAYSHLLGLAVTSGMGRRRVQEVLDMVGLSEVAGRRTGGFSLGMAQRLGIATALLGDPSTVLLDEPVNGLDPEGIRWIRELLRGLATEGRTVFVSSHLMSEMALTADHVIVVGRGRLVADVSTAQLLATASSVRVRSPRAHDLGSLLAGPGVTVAQQGDALSVIGRSAEWIAKTAFAHGLLVYELSPVHPSLEDAYLSLTQDDVEYRAATTETTARRAAA